jgi:hypothetical protein
MSAPGANTDENTQALIAAERLIGRLKDDAVQGLKPDGAGDRPRDRPSDVRIDPEAADAVPYETNEERAFGDIVEELDTAPEIDEIRKALDEPPVEKTRVGPGLKALLEEAEDQGLGVPPGAAGAGPTI